MTETIRCAHDTRVLTRKVEANISKGYLRTTIRFLGDNVTMVNVPDVPTRKYKEIVWCRKCSFVLKAVPV